MTWLQGPNIFITLAYAISLATIGGLSAFIALKAGKTRRKAARLEARLGGEDTPPS